MSCGTETVWEKKKSWILEGQGDYGLIYLATKLTITLLSVCSGDRGMEMSH